MVSKPQHARAALDAICVLQDGRAAGATTIARKRSVFANVIRYAVELEEMPSNPLDRLSWKCDIHADPSVRPELVQTLLHLTDPNGADLEQYRVRRQARVGDLINEYRLVG